MSKQSLIISQLNPALCTPIRTTVLELVQVLGSLTHDDNLVVSAVKEIFRNHKIIATRSLAPVKLVANEPHIESRAGRRRVYLA